MEGTPQAQGLIPRVLEAVFTKLQSIQEDESDTDGGNISAGDHGSDTDDDNDDEGLPQFTLPKFDVVCSFLEIYNEKLYDLLWGIEAPADSSRARQDESKSSSAKRPEIKLKTSTQDQVYVDGLREVRVNSREQALAVFRKGLSARRVSFCSLCCVPGHQVASWSPQVVPCLFTLDRSYRSELRQQPQPQCLQREACPETRQGAPDEAQRGSPAARLVQLEPRGSRWCGKDQPDQQHRAKVRLFVHRPPLCFN